MTRNESFKTDRRTIIGGAAAAATAGGMLIGSSAVNAAQTEATPEATPFGGAEIDPQMQEVLDVLASFEAHPIEDVTPEIARQLPGVGNAALAILTDRGEPGQEPVGDVTHHLIPAPEGHSILARRYVPADAISSGPLDPLPVIVYFHGGGFVIATLDTYDSSCRAIANASGAIVLSIAYRQAPEHPFPAAADDAFTAYQWAVANAGTVGGDPANVAVAGESAGGNLATVTALRARDAGVQAPVHQVLVYPLVSFAPAGEAAASVEQFADAKPLNAPMLEWFGGYYSPDMAAATSPDGSPLDAADLADLPPATVILAEIDPLFSQGELYAQALTDAGVDATVTTYPGVTHEFFGLGAVVDAAMEAVTEAADALKASFGTA